MKHETIKLISNSSTAYQILAKVDIGVQLLIISAYGIQHHQYADNTQLFFAVHADCHYRH